jgi:hypothetical protein
MAKYYCISGEFRLIIDAPCKHECVRKFVRKILQQQDDHNLQYSFLIGINERGFDRTKDTLVASLIPYLKELGEELPDDDKLIEWLSNQIGRPLNNVAIDWLLKGS